jgi:hypothetical protein
MTHLHKPETDDVINSPEKWTPGMVSPFFDRKEFQDRIDAIVGTSRDRQSIIRLSWAPEVWTDAWSQRIPRYWTKRKKDGEGHIYIQPPRWVLEKRIEKEEFAPTWEATRYSTKDEHGNVIDKGPAPEEMYAYQWYIQEHEPFIVEPRDDWGQCCERLWRESRGRCYGYFRLPNNSDLDRISAAVRRMNDETFRNAYAPMTTRDLMAMEARATELSGYEAEQRKKVFGEFIANATKNHAWRIGETDPGKLKHGKYHFTKPDSMSPQEG